MLARTAALRHGGEACLDFKDSASPLLEACGTVQADHQDSEGLLHHHYQARRRDRHRLVKREVVRGQIH